MAFTKRNEAYCQLVVNTDFSIEAKLQAMADAGYKAKDEENARKTLRNLDKNKAVQNRIAELQATRIIATGELTQNDTEEAREIVDALSFFESIYEDNAQPLKSRLECAESALPFEFSAFGKNSKALKMIQGIYKNQEQDLKNRVRTAKVAVTYEEGDTKLGKKEQAKRDAEELTSNSPFATINNQLDLYSSSRQ